MKTSITHKNKTYHLDLSKPLDISMALRFDTTNVNAWSIEPPKSIAEADTVAEGGVVNFRTLTINPHGHGTHTECVGHISAAFESINSSIKQFFCTALVLTVTPEVRAMDLVIDQAQLEAHTNVLQEVDALVIRTLPNPSKKKKKHYSNSNWAYLTEEAAQFISAMEIQHLLIDLPSIDKENDNGQLLAHKAFWNYPTATRYDTTITELIYVPQEILDGIYVLNLQVAPFENDAAPSRPVLYQIDESK